MHICIIDPRTDGHSPTYLRMLTDAFQSQNWQVSAILSDPSHLPDPNRFCALEQLPASKSVARGSRYWRERQRLEDWKAAGLAARQLRSSPNPPDLFLFAWLDGLVVDFSNELRRFRVGRHLCRLIPSLIDRAFPFPWVGLYFLPDPHAQGFLHQCLNARSCRGAFLLNERVIPKLSPKITAPIAFLPDATDTTLLPAEAKQVQQAYGLPAKSTLSKAGKIVVGCLGSIEKRKGILHFLDLAQVMDPQKYHFVMAGELNERSFSSYEVTRIKTVAESVSNLSVILKRLPAESEFNALVDYCDLLYLAYVNFEGSSNLLTKSAYHHKPVLATRGSLMGSRVEKYPLGVTADAWSVAEQRHALESLASEPRAWGFDSYASDFSTQKFNAAVCEHIDKWQRSKS